MGLTSERTGILACCWVRRRGKCLLKSQEITASTSFVASGRKMFRRKSSSYHGARAAPRKPGATGKQLVVLPNIYSLQLGLI